MDFDIMHLQQKFGHPYPYRDKDMTHNSFWVTSDPLDLNGRNMEISVLEISKI